MSLSNRSGRPGSKRVWWMCLEVTHASGDYPRGIAIPLDADPIWGLLRSREGKRGGGGRKELKKRDGCGVSNTTFKTNMGNAAN